MAGIKKSNETEELRIKKMALIVERYKKIQEESNKLYESMMDLTDREFVMVWKAFGRIMEQLADEPRFRAVIKRLLEVDEESGEVLYILEKSFDNLGESFVEELFEEE